MWLEEFQAKYRGTGTVEKKQWDPLLGHLVTSAGFQVLRVTSGSFKPTDHEAGEQSVWDLPAIVFGLELMEAYPIAKVIFSKP